MKTIAVKDIFDPSQLLSVTVPEAESLEHVIMQLASEQQVRSVFLVDKDRRFTGVITRSDILRWVSLRFARGRGVDDMSAGRVLRLVLATKAKDLAHGDWKDLGVKLTDDLQTALAQMIQNDTIDLPVLDEEGRILGNLKFSQVLLEAMHAGRDEA